MVYNQRVDRNRGFFSVTVAWRPCDVKSPIALPRCNDRQIGTVSDEFGFVERNIIVVNSGHRDFVFATRNRALQLRYLVRPYVKELVLKNFAGLPADQLLERMIELSLYAEEKLKSG